MEIGWTSDLGETQGMPRKPSTALPSNLSEDAGAVQMSAPDYSRLSYDDLGKILRLHAEGLTQREIAQVVDTSQQSVGYALKRMSGDAKEVQALAKGKAVQALQQWDNAIETAAKRGDHRPAREFIELAHAELRPTQGNSARGVGVTINIGQPGQPLELPSIQVVEAKVVTDALDMQAKVPETLAIPPSVA